MGKFPNIQVMQIILWAGKASCKCIRIGTSYLWYIIYAYLIILSLNTVYHVDHTPTSWNRLGPRRGEVFREPQTKSLQRKPFFPRGCNCKSVSFAILVFKSLSRDIQTAAENRRNTGTYCVYAEFKSFFKFYPSESAFTRHTKTCIHIYQNIRKNMGR